MPYPVHHLTVLQNWDCHACGGCCKEHVVTITDEERRRIESQRWDQEPDYQGVELFKKRRWQRNGEVELSSRADGSCVFLSDNGRCRIHERFGPEAKPLACRVFPYAFVPAGDHWRVGLRFSCPSAAANKGRPLAQHAREIETFAQALAGAAGLGHRADRANVPAPPMQPGQTFAWPDVVRFAESLLTLLRAPKETIELRLRKCLALARLCRQAKLEGYSGKRLEDFLRLVSSGIDAEVPVDPASLARPGWVGRVLFRQNLFLLARKDHGPERGSALKGRIALLGAALGFARGRGIVPKVHGRFPDSTFEQVEALRRPYSPEMEQTLDRYFLIKVESFQFCGATFFHRPFWEGFESLAATFPVICWLARLFADLPATEAVQLAISIVDSHFGYNPLLGSVRQRLAFRILARTGELDKLIAWYGR